MLNSVQLEKDVFIPNWKGVHKHKSTHVTFL